MNIEFTKMHGLGNDFVVINNMNGRIKLSGEQIIFLCDRHFGVGADGVILVEPSEQADCFMNYYNSDGSVGLCGNGTRCTAKFFRDEINKNVSNLNIDTCAGVKNVKYENNSSFSVNMGKPNFLHSDFPENSIELENLLLLFVSTGNPHAVAVVEDLEKYNLLDIGPKIENNKNFPNKINFEIVEKISESEHKVKVWERGSGATLACGTGATGVYAILRKYKNAPKDIVINLPGGKLFFSENEDGDIIMKGPAVSVYSGVVEI